MRVYDQPNHPHYGPVRRCWVILAGLFPDLAKLDTEYRWEWHSDWDFHLVHMLEQGHSEVVGLRTIVWRCLDATTD